MIVITAASSHYGRLVLDELLSRGIPADQLVATSRDTSSLEDYAAQGLEVRPADYNDPQSLRQALAGAGQVLLISSDDVENMERQHRNVIDAAIAAGATRVVYTSCLNADSSSVAMAAPHAATEQAIKDSGIGYTILRNGNYLENYAGFVGFWLKFHQAMGCAGAAEISFASRADLAAVAAILLAGDTTGNSTHDLGGPAYTMADLVAVASELSGTPIECVDLPEKKYAELLASGGVPESVAAGVADINAGAVDGGWYTDSTELETLLDRPVATPREVFAAALQDLPGHP